MSLLNLLWGLGRFPLNISSELAKRTPDRCQADVSMASLLADSAIDFEGISYEDADFRNENTDPDSLSGGRSHRGGGSGKSGKELQGHPQEKQEEERSATGKKDLRPGGLSSGALFLRLAMFPDIELGWWGRGHCTFNRNEPLHKLWEIMRKLCRNQSTFATARFRRFTLRRFPRSTRGSSSEPSKSMKMKGCRRLARRLTELRPSVHSSMT